MKAMAFVAVTSVKRHMRSRMFIFWVFLFPIIMMTFFGMIFGGSRTIQYTLGVVDHDDSDLSHAFINSLENASFEVEMYETEQELNMTMYSFGIFDKPVAGLILPPDFQETLLNFSGNVTLNVTVIVDASNSNSKMFVSMIQSVLDAFILAVRGSGNLTVDLNTVKAVPATLSNIDIIMSGYSVMVVAYAASFLVVIDLGFEKDRKILRRVLLSRISPYEFIVGKIIAGLVMSFISLSVFWGYSILVFNAHVSINIYSVFETVALALISESLAIIIATFVRKREAGESITTVVIMMLLFLCGAYVPLEVFPEALKTAAIIVPYTWGVMSYRESLVLGRVINWQYPLILCAWAVVLTVGAILAFRLMLRRIST